jgi:hypothetical protein
MSLWEQIRDDCYFFVVSAYEGAALAKGERRLLWRTKLTTAANGISLAESLPSIVLGGTDFFGKPMDATSYVQKKINRSGKVDIGEAQVKEYIEPAKTDGGAK